MSTLKMNKSLNAFREASSVYASIEHTPQLQWLPYCYVTNTTSPMNDYSNLKKSLFGLRLVQTLIWMLICGAFILSTTTIVHNVATQTDKTGVILNVVFNVLVLALLGIMSFLFFFWWIELREAFIHTNWKNAQFARDVLRLDKRCLMTGVQPQKPLISLWTEPHSLTPPMRVVTLCHDGDKKLIRAILTEEATGNTPAAEFAKQNMKRMFELHVQFSLYPKGTRLEHLYQVVEVSAKKHRSLIEPKPDPLPGSSTGTDVIP